MTSTEEIFEDELLEKASSNEISTLLSKIWACAHPDSFGGYVDEDFPDCFTVISAGSYENLLSELDHLSVSTCDDQWTTSFDEEDENSCATPDSVQTACASIYASGISLREEDSRCSSTHSSRFWDNDSGHVDISHGTTHSFKFDGDADDLPLTVDSLIQLRRAQKKCYSFYQLPELNTKPVDYAPHVEYVASQYELPEIQEFAVHNEPWSAQKLKQALLDNVDDAGTAAYYDRVNFGGEPSNYHYTGHNDLQAYAPTMVDLREPAVSYGDDVLHARRPCLVESEYFLSGMCDV